MQRVTFQKRKRADQNGRVPKRPVVRPSFKRRSSPALANALGVEKKFLDVPCTSTALTAPTDASGGEIQPTSVVTGCLSAPAQGDGPSNRDGSRIGIKSILVMGSFSNAIQQDQTDADVMPTLFVALVQDKQTNGATIVSEQVYTNPAADADLAAMPLRNMSFTNRYKVLATQTVVVPQLQLMQDSLVTATASQSGFNIPFVLQKKWKTPLRVQFTTGSTTADVANVIDNSLHIIAFATGTGTVPGIQFTSRLRFIG